MMAGLMKIVVAVVFVVGVLVAPQHCEGAAVKCGVRHLCRQKRLQVGTFSFSLFWNKC